jgi:hypothetical protein
MEGQHDRACIVNVDEIKRAMDSLHTAYRPSVPLSEWMGLDAVVAQCLQDQDIASRSAEWKEGYAQGLREGLLILAQRMLRQKP